MMTNILLNFPEDYQTILETIEDKLYDKDHPLTIEKIRHKISVKSDQMSKQSIPKTSREYEKVLYVKPQYKDTCMTCGRYGYMSKG